MATATEQALEKRLAEDTNEREVLGVFVTYLGVKENWRGKRLAPLTASRGQKVDLFKDDEARLDELHMLVPEDSPANAAQIVAQRTNAALARALNPLDVMVPVDPAVVIVSPPGGGVDPALLGGGEATVIATGGGGHVPVSEGGSSAARAALEGGDVDTVAEVLRAEKPNAADTVALAGDDPERARLLIDAENAARDGDGRSTVLEPLQRIAERE